MPKKIALFSFALFIVFSWSIHTCFAVEQDDAAQMLAKAENDLSSAYTSVVDAERVGADVSGLLIGLRSAGVLLASANNTYRKGDYENAYLLALNCSDTVENMVNEALAMRLETEETHRMKLFCNVGFSSIGISVLSVSSFFGWRLLKKRHHKQILRMEPQMEDEAK
jgi:hypothetical protein